MTCTNPQTIYIRASHPIDFCNWEEHEQHKFNRASMKPKKGYIAIQVPCNRCLGCALDRSNDWATRCVIEAKNWDSCCMITLTYNHKNLPKTKSGKKTLCKKDVQDFIKRLRYHEEGEKEWINPNTNKKEKPIRYFYCGEYGPKNQRPHYHMIIFNWKPKDLEFYKFNKHGDEIYKSKTLYNGNNKGYWGKGFCTVTEMNYNTACYVARYCTKKAGLQKKFRIPLNKPKIDEKGIHTQYFKSNSKPIDTYINMSTGVGIGLKYWIDNIEFLKKWQYITLKINDKLVNKRLPRYFKKKWNEENWAEYEQAKYKNFIKSQEQKQELIKQDNYGDLYTDEEKWQMHLQKIDEKLKKHCNMAGILSRDSIELTDEEKHPFTAEKCGEEVPKRNQSQQYTDSNRRWERILTRWRAQEIAKEKFEWPSQII